MSQSHLQDKDKDKQNALQRKAQLSLVHLKSVHKSDWWITLVLPYSRLAYQNCQEEGEEVQPGADVDRAAVVGGGLLVHCAEQLVKPGQLDVNVYTYVHIGD